MRVILSVKIVLLFHEGASSHQKDFSSTRVDYPIRKALLHERGDHPVEILLFHLDAVSSYQKTFSSTQNRILSHKVASSNQIRKPCNVHPLLKKPPHFLSAPTLSPLLGIAHFPSFVLSSRSVVSTVIVYQT
jgi:hypothetical protein